MRALWVAGCAVAALVATPARAQHIEASPAHARVGSGDWSVTSGKTLGAGTNAVLVDAGWPALGVGLLHGATSDFDIGARASFTYGQEGIPTAVVPGVKLQALTRFHLVDVAGLALELDVSPGVFLQLFPYFNRIGISVPVEAVLGIPLTEGVSAHLSVGVPFWLTFGSFATVAVPVLFGAGFEYHVDPSFALTLNLRIGPTVFATGGPAAITVNALVGIALKL